MKLATYQDGSRDGQLVVVSADLTQAHHASGIATRMQQVLDDWNFLAPQLQDLARTLAQGKARHAFPFEPRMCMAPLPRAYRLVDAQPVPVATQIGAALSGDAMACAHSPLPDAALDARFGARLVVALGDVPHGAAADQARDGVRLWMLANHWQLWRHGQHGQEGELRSSTMAFAPVAVTSDELGSTWYRGRLSLTLCTAVDGQARAPVETAEAGTPDTGALIAQLARHRAVSVGSLLALPGPPHQPLVREVARVEMEAVDALGQSVFGRITQSRPADDGAVPAD